MKKRILAVLLSVAACCACAPFMTACGAEVNYTLNEDESGEKYYTVSVSGYGSALKGDFIIPSEYGEGDSVYPVREIASEGFANTRIRSVTVPASVKVIGAAAFMCCYSLEEVIFDGATELEYIPQGIFAYCESLKTVTLPDSLTEIGNLAFYSSGLESIALPVNLQYIYPQAFEYCFSLTEVAFNENLERIGFRAFYYTALEEAVIPASVHDEVITSENENGETVETYVYGIGVGAFHTCDRLKKVVIDGQIEALASGVFGFCTALVEVTLPASLKTVEGAYYTEDGEFYCGHPFSNCTALSDVYFGGSEEQWAAISLNRTSVTEGGVTYDNSALIGAVKHYGA